MQYLKRFVHRPTETLPLCHAATLVERQDGTFVSAWYAGTQKKAVDVAIYGAVLSPGAAEWTPCGIFADSPDFPEGDPVLFVDASARIWLFFVTMLGDRWDTCQVKYIHSHDGGATWNPPTFLNTEWGWMTSLKPLLRPNGVILLPLYHERGDAFTLRSEDGGKTWGMSNLVQNEAGVLQPTLAPLADGRLLMFLRTFATENPTIWQAVSEDDGRSWSEPYRAPLPNNDSRIDLVRLASGRLALAFNDSTAKRTPLTLALSEDDGATWPYSRNVETNDAEYSYPALIQSQDGLLHLLYTYERTHIAHVACDEEWILSCP